MEHLLGIVRVYYADSGLSFTALLTTELPRSMVPTFLVPLFILLRLLALGRRKELMEVPATEPERFS